MFKRVGAYRTNFPAIGVSEGNATNNKTRYWVHTVLLMTSPHIQVYITLPCMIGSIEIGELCKERAWIFCQRVKSNVVDADEEELEHQ